MKSLWRLGLVIALIAGAGSLYVLSPPQKAVADRQLPAVVLRKDGPVTIVFMGTSLTAGDPWPDRVTQQLETCLKHPLRAFRIAQGGATSAWGLDQVDVVIAKAPDLIVLEFAINDADLRRGLSTSESYETHRALIARLKQALPEAQVILMTTNPATGLRRLLRPRLAAYYALYRDLAAEMDLGLIDLYPRWLALPQAARGLKDGVHPSAESVAVIIVPTVTTYLGGLLGQTCSS